ncbi:ABC transporter substrate-binding protein [Microbacterium sp. YJN-G]|uniref:ABC transporter substrate-binding protein n=1 Tax=Microbacterium sp. YJN-G TaxID=2763257 RepID=UPI001877A908|nr:extracellular solute-binding protein [Microbacterium sp. YJN-G]
MKRMTKAAAMAAAAILPLFALTACGSGGDAEASGDGNTLTVWAWDPSFNIYAMKEAEKVYQKDHPDFELKIVETPWDDLQAKLTTIAQSQQFDELPDIFLMQNTAFQKNVINYPDVFGDYADSDIDFSEFPKSVTAYSTIDDVNYGVPFDSGTAVSALRTDVLEQAGYTVDDFTDTTWDDFIAKGEDVLAKTGKPLLSGIAGSSDLLSIILQSAGGSLFDEDGQPTIADNDVLIDAIKVYTELVESGVFVEVNSWDEYISSFVNGSVAGTINGIWIAGSIQTAEDQAGKWAITDLPKLDGVPDATNYSANGGSSWAISSTGDAKLAADFLASTFAGSTDFYDTILPKAGAVANWIPAGDSSVYAEPSAFFGGQPIFQKVIEFGAKVPSSNTGVYFFEGRDAVSAAMTKVIGGTSIEDALDEAQANVEFAMN